MTSRIPAEAFPPGEFLLDEIEARGWTQDEFASIIGRPAGAVNQIITGKRGVSPEIARDIGAALGTSAMYWMNLDAAYRLWKAGPAPTRFREEARVRELFPVREMLKRGWIPGSENPEVLTDQVLSFFGISSLEATPRLLHVAKKTGYPDHINGSQRAWLFRVRQVAQTLTVRAYSVALLRKAVDALRSLLPNVDGIRQVPRMLADCGVRYVVIEPLPASKIDGVCFWLNASSPVIGMSLRLDRIDNFWFVLRHEIEHVLNQDGRDVAIVDTNTDAGQEGSVSKQETQANEAAGEFCVPAAEMVDFITRHRPVFHEQHVVSFAQRMNVHPGLVVGQLQRRTNNYGLFRKYLVGIRPAITAAAMTDGYGQVIPI